MRLFFAFLFVFISLNLFSQSRSEDVYKHASQVYGIDDVLVNGGEYRTLHPIASGNPFFVFSTFSKENISLIGRDFQNVFLKFDIEQQKIILKAPQDSENFNVIVLNNDYIKSFTLNGRYFVNISDLLEANSADGFYELIYKGSFVFARSYSKEFVATYSSKYPNGKYSETKMESFIFRDNLKHRIKKKKDLYELFPQQKDLIKKFIKDNKIKLSKSSNLKLNILMQYCDEASAK